MSDFTLREFASAANRAIVTAIIFFIAILGASKLDPTQALAATSGTWTNATTGGLWSNPNNWLGGNIADGVGATADFSTLDLTSDNAVNVDSSRTVAMLRFGDTTPTNNWALNGPGSLTLDAGATVTPFIQLKNQTATIAVPVSGTHGMNVDGGRGTLVLTGANTLSGISSFGPGIDVQLANGRALENSDVEYSKPINNLAFSPDIGTFTLGGLEALRSMPLDDLAGQPITLRVGNSNNDNPNFPALTGTGSFEKIGTGTLSFANLFGVASGYKATGSLTITSGAVAIVGTNAENSGTMIVNANGGLKFQANLGGFAGFSYIYEIGGLAGIADFSLVSTTPSPSIIPNGIILYVGSNNADTAYSGSISGTLRGPAVGGSTLAKVGTGTLTLSGVNTFPQLDVYGGTVRVTGSLANNGSANVFIGAGTDFSTACLVRRLPPGGSYAGMGSGVGSATLTTSAAGIRSGQNSATSAADLAMQWRTPNANDAPRLVSDVLHLSGMSPAGAASQTDPYALQMTYNRKMLGGVESVLAADGLLNLAWLDMTQNKPNGLWVNATAGNFGTGLPGEVFQNFQGSWDTFAAANGVTDDNVGNFLGSYGVDTATHTVWAVVNFNGQFSAVPEPAAWVLLAAGALGLLGGACINRCRTSRGMTAVLLLCHAIVSLPRRALRRLRPAVLVLALLSAFLGQTAAAADGIWITTTANQNWSSPSNWLGGTIADGVDAVADFSTLTSGTEVVLDSPRTVGTLKFGATIPSEWAILNGGFDDELTMAVSLGTPLIQVYNGIGTVGTKLNSIQGLTKTGGGTLRFLAPSGVTGVTNVLAGTLRLSHNLSLQNSTVSLGQSTNLVFDIDQPVLGGLAGSGSFVLSTGLSSVGLEVGSDNESTTYSGVMSGDGGLTKIGAGTLTLTGANTYSGGTEVGTGTLLIANALALQNSAVSVEANLQFQPGIGTFTIGGLDAYVPISLTDTKGAPVTLEVGGSDSTNFGVLSGSGSLKKIGSGQLRLESINTYTGLTSIDGGTLLLIASANLANNGSDHVYIKAGDDFGSASLARDMHFGASYAGLGSTSSGGPAGFLGTSADIRAGITHRIRQLVMQWRVGNAGDGNGIASDVINLTGTSHIQADPFALQMTYNPESLGGDQNFLAANGLLVLGSLNTSLNLPNGQWQNAVADNPASGLPGGVFTNVQSSWDAFAAANGITDANVGNFLGSYGVDVAHHTVWAVVDHDGQFAVLPEPATLVLIVIGAAGLWRIDRNARQFK